jgi:predicted  nucleic acid-binding Zn-ribbon protein
MDEIKKENAAARDEIKRAKKSPEFKELDGQLKKARAALKKPTQEARQAMRRKALNELGGMARTVDRFVLGLSIQQGAEQGMDPTPPSASFVREYSENRGRGQRDGVAGLSDRRCSARRILCRAVLA